MSELIQSLKETVSWEDRYSLLIRSGKKLSPLDEADKTEKLLVKGCQSQVWLKAERLEEGKIHFTGESDSLIVQGLLALLISVYSEKKPAEILKISPDFLEELGLKKHLSPNRANGVYSMVKQIMYYAQVFLLLEK